MSRSEEASKASSVKSLTALAGLHSVTAAHLYFEKLQSGLDNILIKGQNIEELWCLVDWHRYILMSWIEVKKQGDRGREGRWFPMTDIWLGIIDAMVDLIFNYALPSQHHQRSIYQGTEYRGQYYKELNLRNMLTRANFENHPPVLDLIIKHQRARIDSSSMQKDFDSWAGDTSSTRNELINDQRDAWTDPPRMEDPFQKLATATRHNIKGVLSEEQLQSRRQCGIESSDFQIFIEEIQENIHELITLLTEEERKELFLALERAFRTALRNRPRVDIAVRYMRFVRLLINTWLPSNPSITSRLDAKFQEGIQSVLIDGIAPCRRGINFTAKDLQDAITLGGDIRGRARGPDDCALWAAARSLGSIEMFKALVDAGAPYTITPRENESPLQAAVEQQNIEILAFLLSSKSHSFQIDVNHADVDGMTALHVAARTCCKRAVDMLLRHPEIDVNARNHDGKTPFLLLLAEWASINRDKHAVVRTFLADKRVDYYCKSTDRYNALHYAAFLTDATLSILLRHFKSIDKQVKYINAPAWDVGTPLHAAVDANSKLNVRLLLRNGADPTVGGHSGSPLQVACYKLHLGPMQELLSLPQSLGEQWPLSTDDFEDNYDPCGCGSPVTLILWHLPGATNLKYIGHVQRALKLVLAAKPDLELRNFKGRSVLCNGIRHMGNNHRHLLIDILRAGANVNSQDNNGDSPLHLLLQQYTFSEELFKILLKWGADPELTNKQGRTAIAAAMIATPRSPYTDILPAIVREHKVEVAVARETQVPRQQKRKKSSLRSMSNPFSVLDTDE